MTLGELHSALLELQHRLNDAEKVPDRWTTSTKAHLADVDERIIGAAASVVHRLMLWDMYPTVTPEAYFPREDDYSVKV